MKTFAFVFPGQGSQAVGMLDGWAGHPAVVQALQEASDALGEDVGRLIQDGPKEQLALTKAQDAARVFVPNGDQIIGKGLERITVQTEDVATVFAEVNETLIAEAAPVVAALQAIEG